MKLEEVMHHHMQNVYSELKHNPKAFNEASEVFARTKLIDLSNLNVNAISVYPAPLKQVIDSYIQSDGWERLEIGCPEINLPFTDCMCKFKISNKDETFMFIREYRPFVYTGTLITWIEEIKNYYKSPFRIFLQENGSAYFDLDVNFLLEKKASRKDIEKGADIVVGLVMNGINIINQLSPKTTDIYYVEPKGHEYIKRKGLPAIKIERPIYIYANKKTKATSFSEYSGRHIEHQISWSVRGHWRRLDSMQKIGKNAQGEYNVEGFTWVVPHISGNKNVEPSNRKYVAIGD